MGLEDIVTIPTSLNITSAIYFYETFERKLFS